MATATKKTAAPAPRSRAKKKPLSADAQKLKDVLHAGAAVLSKRVRIMGEGGSADNLGPELAALFARHGITVRDVEVSEVREPSASLVETRNNVAHSGAALVKAREIPGGLDCLDAAASYLDATIGALTERLEGAGVLASLPQAGECLKEEARSNPSTPLAQRLFDIEMRALRMRSAVQSLINRLEA